MTRYYLLSLPAVLVAIAIGRVLNRRLGGRDFLRWAYAGLVVTALALLVQTLRA